MISGTQNGKQCPHTSWYRQPSFSKALFAQSLRQPQTRAPRMRRIPIGVFLVDIHDCTIDYQRGNHRPDEQRADKYVIRQRNLLLLFSGIGFVYSLRQI